MNVEFLFHSHQSILFQTFIGIGYDLITLLLSSSLQISCETLCRYRELHYTAPFYEHLHLQDCFTCFKIRCPTTGDFTLNLLNGLCRPLVWITIQLLRPPLGICLIFPNRWERFALCLNFLWSVLFTVKTFARRLLKLDRKNYAHFDVLADALFSTIMMFQYEFIAKIVLEIGIAK